MMVCDTRPEFGVEVEPVALGAIYELVTEVRQQPSTCFVQMCDVHSDEHESSVGEDKSVDNSGVEQVVGWAHVDQLHSWIANCHPKFGHGVDSFGLGDPADRLVVLPS